MITTSRQIQLLIKNYYSSALESKNIQIVKSSRGGLHLRINYGGDVEQMLNSIHPCNLIVSEISISGTFITNELILKENLPDGIAKKGDAIYFVNAVSSKGVLKSKQLTPNKLSITGVKIKKTEFLNKITLAIEKLDVPNNIKFFLNEIAEQSTNQNPKLSDKYIGAISDTDVQIIAKDFGEISGALWFSNVYNKNIDSIEYPSEESFRLIDYYVYEGKKKISISAKSKEGAPPSIDSIAKILKTMTYSTIDMKKEMARKAIIAISDNSAVDGIVLASKTLDTPGYKWIKKNLFNNRDFTANDCETIMKSFQSPEEVFARLDPLYKAMNRSPSLEKVKFVFNTRRKRLGILISPLGYHLIDQLNNNNDYLEVLNDAAKTIMATQLYIKINKSTRLISYDVKEFSASNFKFDYNANAGEPSLKKISFKMNKKR